MLSTPILLIPLAIVCVGVIVISIYAGIREVYINWFDSLKDGIKKDVNDSVNWKINDEIVRRLDEVAKAMPEYSEMKERFQKLAGITPAPSPSSSGNSLRERFNRIRSTCYNTTH
jgi:hypothetical protein